jgi:hypothetical protein
MMISFLENIGKIEKSLTKLTKRKMEGLEKMATVTQMQTA